jgi:hypothetical protein
MPSAHRIIPRYAPQQWLARTQPQLGEESAVAFAAAFAFAFRRPFFRFERPLLGSFWPHNIPPRPPVYRILERVAVSCFQWFSAISNPCTVY